MLQERVCPKTEHDFEQHRVSLVNPLQSVSARVPSTTESSADREQITLRRSFAVLDWCDVPSCAAISALNLLPRASIK